MKSSRASCDKPAESGNGTINVLPLIHFAQLAIPLAVGGLSTYIL